MIVDSTIGVVGNPNCGKTTLFNVLTGSRQHVGNWPGVTVEKKTGEYSFADKHFSVVDLPGTYSLEAADDQVSLDEKIARDFVALKQADLVLNIIDASVDAHLFNFHINDELSIDIQPQFMGIQNQNMPALSLKLNWN